MQKESKNREGERNKRGKKKELRDCRVGTFGKKRPLLRNDVS